MQRLYAFAARVLSGAAVVLLFAALAAGVSQRALGDDEFCYDTSLNDCTSNSCATCTYNSMNECKNSSGGDSCASGTACSGCTCQVTARGCECYK